jgi:hypothetical protein
MKNILTTLVVGIAFFALANAAQAAQIQSAKVTLGDSRPAVASSYQFDFKHTTAATIKKVTFEWCTTASGAGGTCPQQTTGSGSIASAAKSDVVGLGTDANWEVTVNNRMITLTHNATAPGSHGVAAAGDVSVSFTGITNTSLTECDVAAGADTCYIWITTYGTNETSPVDTGVVTYTIVESVLVTAKVDPTFTFLVSSVAAGAVNNLITASVTTSSSTLPFGSLQANIPKYAAHELRVTTNTQGGYTVSAQMVQQMTGVYAQNNIDPFAAPWGTPTTWTLPTGTIPNTNTGWIGANTTDVDITGWGTAPEQKFGAISDSAVVVSQKTSSDAGDAVFVTYALGVNVYQPSDSYRGALIYNALPTY